MRHAIILEPDPEILGMLDRVFAGLHWSSMTVPGLDEAAEKIAGSWAAVLSVESGDLHALDRIHTLHAIAPETVICVLVDELYPDFDRQLRGAGVDAIIAKPVKEREIVEALVSGFTTRRTLRRG